MNKKEKRPLTDRAIWIAIGIVFLCLLGVLVAVYAHEKRKPDSPHALVAAAFNQMFSVREWKPGMGKQPLFYHPAGANQLVWRPLPGRPGFAGQIGQGFQAPPR